MWRLDQNFTACIASGRVILLDEARDRYFAVSPESTEPVRRWLDAADGSEAPSLLRSLLRAADPTQLTNRDRQLVEMPEPKAAFESTGLPGVASIASVVTAVISTRVALRVRPLGSIFKQSRRARSHGLVAGSDHLDERARDFMAARRWCPVAPNCLLDSLAFDRWLGSPRDVQIVFGVVGQPFEAHCWVQSGRVVLNDSYDRVSRFEAILTL